jgi:Zn-dependent protease with chaperone function
MTAPYLLRLFCLCLASFFLLHLGLAAAVASVAGWALRRAEALAPQRAARLLLALRLLPPVVATVVVAGICAPSYLWLEPEATAEDVGWACLTAAALGGWICAAGLVRAGRAAVRSNRYLRHCRAVAESEAPVVLLAGVFRTRLVVSRGVRKALAPDQLAAALRHERAHRASRDNLKRLVLAAAPGVAPFGHGLRSLELGWARMAEWAADDCAAAGSPRRSLALAGALVKVARMGAAPPAAPLATGLMADAADLSVRVERLLNPRAPVGAEWTGRWWPGVLAAATGAAVAIQPGTLYAAHRWLEALMR